MKLFMCHAVDKESDMQVRAW